MFRPSTRSLALLAATIIAAACGSGAREEPQIRGFFRASQLRDSQTLSTFATTMFDPVKQGVVTRFDVTSLSEERRTPLQLSELAKAHEDARAADDEFTKRKSEYQKENREAIDRVLKAERANQSLRGKDAAVQAAWRKWRDDTAVYAKRVSEARTKLNAQRPIAELSLDNPRAPVDVTKLDGQLIEKDVTIAARVRLPADQGGQTVDKTMVVTMQKASGKIDGKDVDGRWIITSVKEGAAPAQTS